MLELILKSATAGLLVGIISLASKKSITMAALFMGIPVTAFIAMIFMYYGGTSLQDLSQWSQETIIFVLTSLIFFVIFSYTVTVIGFWPSFLIGSAITIILYNIVLRFI